MTLAQNQPSFVCKDCGRKYGHHPDALHEGDVTDASWHIGTPCGVCKRRDVLVTEARTYGYLIEGWQPRLLID